MPETNPTEKAAQDATVRAESTVPAPAMHALRQLRLLKGLNQADFAKLIGWSSDAVGYVERGERPAGDRLVVALSQALGISVASARQLADGTMPEELQGSGKAGAA